MKEMPARFVNIDHDTPLLLPPDLRDWVSQAFRRRRARKWTATSKPTTHNGQNT
jgi:hypothetical protein